MPGLATNPMPEDLIADWLTFHEATPIVSGWQWSESIWQTWTRKLNQWQIPNCRDSYGNILLGVHSVGEFFHKIKIHQTRLILQSHLDHPGVCLLKKIHQSPGKNRYIALKRGGLVGTLQGLKFLAYDSDSQFLGEYVIDKQISGYNETLLSFKTCNELPNTVFLHGPQNDEGLDFENYFCGWAMDNHIGCACVVSCLSQSKPKDVLGILTLDEEIGALGLRSLLQESAKHHVPISDWPLLLTLEVTPEYKDLGLTVSNGARVRCADALESFNENFSNWAQRKFTHEPLKLTRGSCEAGYWTRWGGRAGCLVIPCKYYHNGTTIGEWRAEHVAKMDVNSLISMLNICGEQWKNKQSSPHQVFSRPQRDKDESDGCLIDLNDHTRPLYETVHETTNYVDCLNQILPVWNVAHKKFGLNVMKFSQEAWPYWHEEIMKSASWIEKIKKLTSISQERVSLWLDSDKREDKIPIHIFVGANFNASNIAQGVAFSTDKLKDDDLERVIVHELTHWFLKPYLDHSRFRPLWKTFLHEGFACLATMELLDLPIERALCLPESMMQKNRDSEPLLKSLLNKWAEGELLTVTQSRHEVVKNAFVPHPYQLGNNPGYPKYGYYLAVRFLKAVMGGYKLQGVNTLSKITETSLTQWLKKEIP